MSNIFPGDSSDDIFHKVISLTESDYSWEALSKNMPNLPRGWFELSRLDVEERLEFTRDFWLSKLLFSSTDAARYERRLEDFFSNLEEVEIYATQESDNMPFELHMIYVMEDATGFFQGGPPPNPAAIETLKKQFSHCNLPPDFLSFLEIHDGFSKYTDTGILKVGQMAQTTRRLQELLAEEVLVRPDGQVIDPQCLIPFYESFGLHSYQCFYSDWYPEDEMGNVYFSEHDRTISNFLDAGRLEENLAFPTFLGWLVFYLEDIWHL
ncbi:MAG: SMI1/KNR4 family protein [Chlamydiales bacterium]|nr:SMI1/KNR4 family protein [Chlamydiales bacterium]